MTVTAETPAAFRRRGGIPDAYGWDDLAVVLELTGDANHIHIPGSPYEWKHPYVPLAETAARSHGHGKVPKGWTAPGGGSKGKAVPKAAEAPAAAPAPAKVPAYAKDFKNPATVAEDAKARQALKADDYDTMIKHLQAMDKLEKQAGVGEGEGMRPAIAKTAGQVKMVKQAKQRELRELPKQRGREASRIADTAGQVITGQSPYIKTTPEQAAQVQASMREASNALMSGDHEGALRHLAAAREAAKGPNGTSVGTGGRDGRGAVYRIAEHEKNVQRLTADAKSLARYAPQPKAPKPAGPKVSPAAPSPSGMHDWAMNPAKMDALMAARDSAQADQDRALAAYNAEPSQQNRLAMQAATRKANAAYRKYESTAKTELRKTQVDTAKRWTAADKEGLPGLVKTSSNPDGSFAAVDHNGTEHTVRLEGTPKRGTVTVTSAAGTRSMPAIGDPTRAARILAGNLAGTNRTYGTSKRGRPVMQGDTVVVPDHPATTWSTTATRGGKGVVYGATGGDKVLVATGDHRAYISASPGEVVHAATPPVQSHANEGGSMARTWNDLDAVIDLAVRTPVKTPVAKAPPARLPGKPAAAAPAVPPQRSPRKVPLTPMRREAAKSMRKLAASVQESHPDMTVHDHLRDAARTLESGQEEASQRHLRAAMFALTPQSLMRNGLHTDDAHQAGRQVMHSVHRHVLLVKDIVDVAAKNQEAIRRLGGEDDTAPRPDTDPSNGYGPGALAQKPTARQPGGDRALNAPNRSSSGGSDPAVADPDGPQPRGSKQFTYGWGDLSALIEIANCTGTVDLVGPKGYIHGWIYVGGAGLPSVAGHNARLKARGVTPPTKAHPALTSKPPGVKAAPKATAAAKAAPAAAKEPAAPTEKKTATAAVAKPAPAVKQESAKTAPAGISPEAADEAEKQAESISMLGQFGGKSTQLTVIKKRPLSELQAADYGFQQRAAERGHPDKVTAAHQMVRDEITKRGGKLADLTAPVRVQGAAEVAQRERKALIVAWSSSYRYKGISEVANNKRIADFATEMHRLMSTSKPPVKCGPGCQDAHKFLTMVDSEAKPQPRELQRGLTLSPAAAERMFQPGKKMDMPASSWTADPEVGALYSKGEGKPGKVRVLLHAAPGAKGMDISALSNWHASAAGVGGEAEVVTGGRFNVQSVKTEGGVMHVYLTQSDFSAH